MYRPAYAPDYSSEEEDEEVVDMNVLNNRLKRAEHITTYEPNNEAEQTDRRMRRLQARHADDVDSDDDQEAR